jgi:hypothetical protein
MPAVMAVIYADKLPAQAVEQALSGIRNRATQSSATLIPPSPVTLLPPSRLRFN